MKDCINFKGVELMVSYYVLPAEENVGLNERVVIDEVFYDTCEVSDIIDACGGWEHLREKVHEEYEKGL